MKKPYSYQTQFLLITLLYFLSSMTVSQDSYIAIGWNDLGMALFKQRFLIYGSITTLQQHQCGSNKEGNRYHAA